MAKNLMLMKQERAALVQQARAITDAAEAREDKALTADENAKIAALIADADKRAAEIGNEERLQAMEASTRAPEESKSLLSQDFRDFGEFLQEVAFNRSSSSRLKTRDVREARTSTMADDVSAGYLVPTQFETTIRQVSPQEAVFRPRAQHISGPASSPDAPIELLALDQSGANGVYSGISVSWVGETEEREDAGDPKFRRIRTEPHEVSGYIEVSDKLMRNSAAVGEFVQRILRQAIVSAEEHAFLTGDGTGKPTGIIGHASNVLVTREQSYVAADPIADTPAIPADITYNDIVNMYSSAMTGSSVWIANRNILPRLMHLKDSAGNMIWQPNGRDGAPQTLIGLPLLFNERSPSFGAAGDLVLTDLSYYVIRDGSPLAIKVEPYTGMKNQVVKIYAFWNVDGVPLLNTPLTQENGVTQVSPFVTLAA